MVSHASLIRCVLFGGHGLCNSSSPKLSALYMSVGYWQKRTFYHEEEKITHLSYLATIAKDNNAVTLHGEIPTIYPSLKERLEELEPAVWDPEKYKKVNIGMKQLIKEKVAATRAQEKRILRDLRQNLEKIMLSEQNKFEVDITEVKRDWCLDTGPREIRRLALHCSIYQHLFGPYAYFDPFLPLTINYNYSQDEVTPVFTGNIIKPREARNAPSVSFTSPKDSMWTLLCTNPDGDLYKADSECIHWLITDIKGCDLHSGRELVPYLPPVPPKGAGYQRVVFVLFSQIQSIEDIQPLSDPHDLRLRSFSTEQFYRRYEEVLTPVGLAWFNTDWDSSLREFFHNTLGMKEPIFEYEFPKPSYKDEEVYPIREYFIRYMDRYRDPKEVDQQMLEQRLRHTHPFKKGYPRLPFPGAVPINPNIPSWLSREIRMLRSGLEKYSAVYSGDPWVDVWDKAHLRRAAEAEEEHVLADSRDARKWRRGPRKLKADVELWEKSEFERRQKIVEESKKSS